jgi:hypothetical protein
VTPTGRRAQPTTTGSAAASDAVAFRHVDAEDPTVLHRHLDAGRLQVHPAVINNGGETLTNQARALIEAAFGAEWPTATAAQRC